MQEVSRRSRKGAPGKRGRRALRQEVEKGTVISLFVASLAAGVAIGWHTRSFFTGLLGGLSIGAALFTVACIIELAADEKGERLEGAIDRLSALRLQAAA